MHSCIFQYTQYLLCNHYQQVVGFLELLPTRENCWGICDWWYRNSIYMFLMPFVLLNLFVGFVIVTFQKYGVKSFRKTKLDRNQVWLLKSVLFARIYYLIVYTTTLNQCDHHLESMWPPPWINVITTLNQCDYSLSQRNCLYFALTARPYRRYYPSYKIHQKIHKFVNHAIFKIVIFIALVLNIILLALLVSSLSDVWMYFACRSKSA